MTQPAASPASAADLLTLVAASFPHARLQQLPRLGHMAPVTDPDTVNSLIGCFIHASG